MTPKEKAIELVQKYFISVEVFYKQDSIPNILKAPMTRKSFKECALIAVEEIIEHCNYANKWYWQDVKQEIESL